MSFRGEDWPCPDESCGNMNFARRVECNRCGCAKPMDSRKKKSNGSEIGQVMSQKSNGLFSSDDWQCSKCANVNWARRSTCNVCNAPRFTEEEERTGLGGGFNERGVIEYKRDRGESSDEEFDDFGRRKKKFRMKKLEKNSKELQNVIVKEREVDLRDHNTDDGEEEEEEDDEEDVGKYDLWGDGDGSSEDGDSATALRKNSSDDQKDSKPERRKNESLKMEKNNSNNGRDKDQRHGDERSSKTTSSRHRSRSPAGRYSSSRHRDSSTSHRDKYR